MGFREHLRRSELVLGLVRDARRAGVFLRRPLARRALTHYLSRHDVRKLHLGAGGKTHPGWLGTDIQPRTRQIVCLDATKPMPVQDATFDYVYSEHMIEHLTWEQGLAMLRECHRILRPGGRLRIATPDLAVIVGLYDDPTSEARDYIKAISDKFLHNVGDYRATFVINNAFHAWGHKFLYDGELLRSSLEAAGFTDIRRHRPQQSDDPSLRGIECHGLGGNERRNEFETMVYEATRA